MPRGLFKFSLVLMLVTSLAFSVGVFSAQYLDMGVLNITRTMQDGESIDMSLFWEVLDLVNKTYIDRDKIDNQKLLYGAISGMVAALGDPYTSFFTPEENTSFKDNLEGRYEGIGAQLGFEGDQLVIVAPLADSPAEHAGISPGDSVFAVDGESTNTWSLEKAVQEIRGEAGTAVKLMLSDREVEIIRDEITIPAVRLTWLVLDSEGKLIDSDETTAVQTSDRVAYIKVLRFGSDTVSEWDSVLDDVAGKDLDGVILDVRNNPGGLLSAAIYLASDFFESGVVVKKQSNSETQEFKVNHRCRLCLVKTVVLINEGSASASEILAGALQRRDRAVLVGHNSFGKGTVQESIQVGDSAVHITNARWLLPDDQNITDTGLEPNIVADTEIMSGPFGGTVDDMQLKRAFEELQVME